MEFNVGKMNDLAMKDRLIKFMVDDLMKKGHSVEEALKTVYNSEVMGDSVMEEAYKNA